MGFVVMNGSTLWFAAKDGWTEKAQVKKVIRRCPATGSWQAAVLKA